MTLGSVWNEVEALDRALEASVPSFRVWVILMLEPSRAFLNPAMRSSELEAVSDPVRITTSPWLLRTCFMAAPAFSPNSSLRLPR